MCVLSPISVVMCSQARQRENARKHLCYFTFSHGGRDLLCPRWWKVMQTSHCPALTDLHGENFVGHASVAPKWQVLQGHQRITTL